MKKFNLLVALACLAMGGRSLCGAGPSPVAPGAELTKLADGFKFTEGPAADAEGNVYLTGRGVTVFDKTGKKIHHINVRPGWTANVCFGGKDRKTLFITASRNLFSIRMRVAGVGANKKVRPARLESSSMTVEVDTAAARSMSLPPGAPAGYFRSGQRSLIISSLLIMRGVEAFGVGGRRPPGKRSTPAGLAGSMSISGQTTSPARCLPSS